MLRFPSNASQKASLARISIFLEDAEYKGTISRHKIETSRRERAKSSPAVRNLSLRILSPLSVAHPVRQIRWWPLFQPAAWVAPRRTRDTTCEPRTWLGFTRSPGGHTRLCCPTGARSSRLRKYRLRTSEVAADTLPANSVHAAPHTHPRSPWVSPLHSNAGVELQAAEVQLRSLLEDHGVLVGTAAGCGLPPRLVLLP